MRVGLGYDVHQLVSGRKLILGGVQIPYDRGLLGRSDADVLLHAITDALLGAAGLGDIGRHFPDTEERYEGIASLVLLGRAAQLLGNAGWRVGNLDAVIIAQAPRLSPYINEMNNNIARVLGLNPDCINIKATTTEGLGFTGAGEGIAAYAAALINKMEEKE